MTLDWILLAATKTAETSQTLGDKLFEVWIAVFVILVCIFGIGFLLLPFTKPEELSGGKFLS